MQKGFINLLIFAENICLLKLEKGTTEPKWEIYIRSKTYMGFAFYSCIKNSQQMILKHRHVQKSCHHTTCFWHFTNCFFPLKLIIYRIEKQPHKTIHHKTIHFPVTCKGGNEQGNLFIFSLLTLSFRVN